MEIDITEEELKYLSASARQELDTIATQYAKEIINEASRLEAGERKAGENPDISRIHIRDASISSRRHSNRSNKPKWFIPLKIAAAISGIAAGILIPDTPNQLTGFSYILVLLLFAFALVTTTIDVIWSNK